MGSNSVLLLVSEFIDGRWNPVFEDTRVTALGEGTKLTGLLSDEAMDRTLSAIRGFVTKAEELDCPTTLAAATMAARIASNSMDFLNRAKAQGTPIEILSGDEEAQLGFDAVVNDPIFAGHPRISIVDPGGQSTEVVIADRMESGWNVLFKNSYPVGTLGLKSTYLPDETPSGIQILRASGAIDEIVGRAFQPNDPGVVVVLGAAGTNLVSIRDQLAVWQPEKVHGSILNFEQISNFVGQLMQMSATERAAMVGMEKGREKTIHVGALLLERFLFASSSRGMFCQCSWMATCPTRIRRAGTAITERWIRPIGGR